MSRLQRRQVKVKLGAVLLFVAATAYWFGDVAFAQLIDRTKNPNKVDAGIAESLQDQVGTGRGDMMTRDSSVFIIKRDPFRSIRRGRQLFQRKFLRTQAPGRSRTI